MLAYDQSPPFSAPMRFFLTAPLFLTLAGVMLLIDGDSLLASRWTPGALAATHLITVGFMLQVMLGALIQIMPVLTGASLPRPLWLARLVHAGLSVGALLLAAGFRWGHPEFLTWAAVLLGLSVLLFLVFAGLALRKVPTTSPSTRGIKLSLWGLLGGIGLGVALAGAIARGWGFFTPALVDLHAGIGLAVWAGLLLAAIAYVVVPMFQLTPAYPTALGWRFPLAVIVAVTAWGLGVAVGHEALGRVGQGLLALLGAAFCGFTLRLQSLRRRAKSDVTSRYWQLGLIAGALALAMLATTAIRPGIADDPAWTPVFGLLLIAGGFVPLIVGMMCKIVPFLAWLQLQDFGRQRVAAPPMNKLLPEGAAEYQRRAYVLALALLVPAPMLPELLARPAGLALAVAGLWLAWNLAGAGRRYRQARRDIAQKQAVK